MSTLFIAIDPGAGGGFAWKNKPDAMVQSCNMPDTMPAIADKLSEIINSMSPQNINAVIEQVGTYMPGNSGPAAVTFARHCGQLEAILYCLGIPTQQVLPKKWQDKMPLTKFRAIDRAIPDAQASKMRAQRKAIHKNEIKDYVARRFPHLRVTLNTADALGIYLWATEDENERS